VEGTVKSVKRRFTIMKIMMAVAKEDNVPVSIGMTAKDGDQHRYGV